MISYLNPVSGVPLGRGEDMETDRMALCRQRKTGVKQIKLGSPKLASIQQR